MLGEQGSGRIVHGETGLVVLRRRVEREKRRECWQQTALGLIISKLTLLQHSIGAARWPQTDCI